MTAVHCADLTQPTRSQVKRLFEDCAKVLRVRDAGKGEGKGAEQIEKASTRWIRHSHASHAIASGIPIEIAPQNPGHASLSTTTVYVTTEKRWRLNAVEAIWKRSGYLKVSGRSAD